LLATLVVPSPADVMNVQFVSSCEMMSRSPKLGKVKFIALLSEMKIIQDALMQAKVIHPNIEHVGAECLKGRDSLLEGIFERNACVERRWSDSASMCLRIFTPRRKLLKKSEWLEGRRAQVEPEGDGGREVRGEHS
jgi:hypothetical protein